MRFVRTTCCATVVFVGIGLAAGASPAYAAKATVHGAGTVVCTMSGTVKYTPGQLATSHSIATKVKATFTCATGTTGNPAVTVTGGKFSGTSPSYSGSCTHPPPVISGQVKWKAHGGKVLPTGLALSTSTPAPPALHLDGPVSGSYSGESHAFGQVVVTGACGGTKPEKNATFTGSLRIQPKIHTTIQVADSQNGFATAFIDASLFNLTTPSGAVVENSTQCNIHNVALPLVLGTAELHPQDIPTLFLQAGCPDMTLAYAGDSLYSGSSFHF